MDASSGPSPPRQPLGLIGMIGLVVLVEISLVRSDRLPTYQSESWRMAARAAAEEAVGCDILCFGDSLIEFNVLPTMLEDRLGGHAFNLSVPNGSAASSYFLLRRALEAGALPRAIVVDFMPHQLASRSEATRRRAWPELASVRETLELASVAGDADLATTIWLAQLLPSFKGRFEIRSLIVSFLKRSPFSLPDAIRVLLVRRNLRINRGAFVMGPSERVGPDPAGTIPNLELFAKQYDLSAVAYTDLFLGLAASRSIPVYCLVPPISPEYQSRADADGSAAIYTAFLRAKQAQFPNLIVVDGRSAAGYNPMLFVDCAHLDCLGAKSLTDGLAKVLAQPPSEERWIDLPRYRQVENDGRVEDLAQALSVFDRAARASLRR